jgi:hypothetical protein
LTSCFTVFAFKSTFSKTMAADAPSNILAKNVAQFAKVPQVAGQKPYRHIVYKAFYPVTPALPPGTAALPLAAATSKKKPGQMACSFADGGKSNDRNTSVTRLVDIIIGPKDRPKTITLTPALAHHQAQLDSLVAELTVQRRQAR